MKNEQGHYRDRTSDYYINTFSPIVIPRRFFPPEPDPKPTRKSPPASIWRYGMSRDEYWALEDKQSGRCAICGDFPNEGRALHLDHCHETNKVRALLCHHCNIAVGMIRDDPETARAIADYLEKHNIGTTDA